MKLLPLLASASLLCSSLATATPAVAAVPQCNGQDATIVVDQPDESTARTTVYGTPGDDVIVVTAEDRRDVDALAGEDSVCIDAPGGDWQVNGGGDDDHLEAGPGASYVHGDGGDDVLLGLDTGNNLKGDDGDDTLTGNDQTDFLNGGAGDDTLTGAGGDDYLTAGPGDDSLDGGPGGDSLIDEPAAGDLDSFQGGEGEDRFVLDGDTDRVDDGCDDPATQVPLSIDLSAGTITGGAVGTLDGFESYVGGSGVNTWWGTDGVDVFDSNGCGQSLFHGQGGDDQVFIDSDDSEVWGGAGDDEVDIQASGVTARGGSGDDAFRRFYLAQGSVAYRAELDGGRGRDVVNLHLWDFGRLRIDLVKGRITSPYNPDATIATLTRVEDAVDGPRAGVLLGNGADNHLYGLGGNDRIDGRHGRDLARGGSGTDWCHAEVRNSCEQR